MIPNQIYATIAAALLVIGIITTQYIKIQFLKTDIAELQTEVAYKEVSIEILKTSGEICKKSITIQNEAITKLAVDKAETDKKFAAWKAQPEDIRYKVIYKIREAKSDACEDIKSTINSIRSIDFNSL